MHGPAFVGVRDPKARPCEPAKGATKARDLKSALADTFLFFHVAQCLPLPFRTDACARHRIFRGKFLLVGCEHENLKCYDPAPPCGHGARAIVRAPDKTSAARGSAVRYTSPPATQPSTGNPLRRRGRIRRYVFMPSQGWSSDFVH